MKAKNQHIVFLTPGFARSENDSTVIPALQVYLKSIKQALPNSKMTLLSFQFPFTKKPYKWNGISVIPLHGKNKRIYKLWTWKKALRKLKTMHHHHPITTIHSFWIGECAMIGTKFSTKYNIQHIVTAMGQDASLGNSYAKRLQNTNATLVSLSKNHQELITKNYQLKSKCIPWDIDTSSFPELQENTIDILGVGSINRVKNYTSFIKIISKLTQEFPNLKVSIIGEGEERNKINKQIKEAALENTISLLGELPRAEVLQKMAQAKLFLHTSSYESFGFVFSEALYSGMQIVSNNVGIATAMAEWEICTTETEIITACSTRIRNTKNKKKRVLLNAKNACVSSYLDLYHE
ncbi:glycosyltransferase [Oceanihabitans sp. 2_MG-2023]|uniref:glycosyltransferase n=1 Tax=Oceanihabitans sp. 2_MG-2023 TaxID=3062661 RepID=UPI0026E3CCCA|nr:glycosyltransferase [Oceanihabitans sp. 2_MG-2023]MDO6596417.1 glycosyltransferase [Oceanihabitans sp. 2_MG-2023]